MSNTEFDIIKKYFTFSHNRNDVNFAIGDDCASVTVPEGKQLLVTADTLISGVHFPENTAAEDIAYKAIMVNLSDLAAMGATPAWLTLAITLPKIDEKWLQAFSDQLKNILTDFNICLIGGDTTKGHLSITIQAMGLCDTDKILRRSQAAVGDKIFVTGYMGDAAIGLGVIMKGINDEVLLPCIQKLNRPEARVKFAEELVLYAKCAIDVSDGLIADLGHVVDASGCGARIDLQDIQLSASAKHYFEHYNNNEVDWSMVLAQGDDYELCFTVNNNNEAAVQKLAEKHHLKISCIGEITDSSELLFIDLNGKVVNIYGTGFQHF
ncbi:MAG: thiamine-phosphate kinase [Gammaproteobacteria bacterium]|nr:MAG: thiamine-phosphate kinase [Gammaproteobacteria bacterium]